MRVGFLLWVFLVFETQAGERVTGHVKGFFETDEFAALDFRVSQEGGDDWHWLWSYQLQASYGSELAVISDETQLFNLTQTLVEDRDRQAWHKLDRFHLGYSKGDLTFRFGRQALTLGQGIVFHPMDILNPFSPWVIDKSYKPGTDLLNFGQSLPNGHELNYAFVPRRSRDSGHLSEEESTLLAYGSGFISEGQWHLYVGQDYANALLGTGYSLDWHEVQWQMNWVSEFWEEDWIHSALVNAQGAGQVADRNVTWLIEFYHNGFGREAAVTPEIMLKLQRQQLFVTGKHYGALGGSIELSPLWIGSMVLSRQLSDTQESSLQIMADGSLSDDVTLSLGGSVLTKDDETEYWLILNVAAYF